MNFQVDETLRFYDVTSLLSYRAQSVIKAFEMSFQGVVRCCREFLSRQLVKLFLEPAIEQPIMVCADVPQIHKTWHPAIKDW